MILSPSPRTRRATWLYAETLYLDGATVDDLREAVTTLEEAGRITRHLFGGQHPHTTGIERTLRDARAALRALPLRLSNSASSISILSCPSYAIDATGKKNSALHRPHQSPQLTLRRRQLSIARVLRVVEG